jgi:hypothetical protein
MVQRVSTVAFEGIEARAVDVHVQVAPGLPAFAIVEGRVRLSSWPHRRKCNGIPTNRYSLVATAPLSAV